MIDMVEYMKISFQHWMCYQMPDWHIKYLTHPHWTDISEQYLATAKTSTNHQLFSQHKYNYYIEPIASFTNSGDKLLVQIPICCRMFHKFLCHYTASGWYIYHGEYLGNSKIKLPSAHSISFNDDVTKLIYSFKGTNLNCVFEWELYIIVEIHIGES